MKNTIRSAFAALLIGLTPALWAATEVAGVSFDAQTAVDGSPLALNGAGLRTRAFSKVYAMGLYVPQRAAEAEALIAQNGPRRIRLVTLRDLSAEQLSDALAEGLAKNHDAAALAVLQPRIDALRELLLGLKAAPKGSNILIDFSPAGGTRVQLEGVTRGAAIPGADFFQALLRVWLGREPADADLKKALLGAAS